MISAGLSTGVTRQIFFTMYPEPACQPMLGTFVRILQHESSRQFASPEIPLAAFQAVA